MKTILPPFQRRVIEVTHIRTKKNGMKKWKAMKKVQPLRKVGAHSASPKKEYDDHAMDLDDTWEDLPKEQPKITRQKEKKMSGKVKHYQIIFADEAKVL